MKRYKMFMTLKNQKGVALIVGLFVLVTLSAIGTVATFNTHTDVEISGNVKDIKQAFYLAEAGISHAGDFINYTTDVEWANYAPFQTLIPATTLGAAGNYTVTIEDAGGDLRRVVSAGSTNSGGYTEIEAIFGREPWTPEQAIITGGDLTISGNPTVSGACGRVHANEDLTMTGNPNIVLTATASQIAFTTGEATINGVLLDTNDEKDQYGIDSSNEPEVRIPPVRPTNFYDLGSMSFDHTLICSGPHAGKFRNGDGLGPPISPYGGWEFNGTIWIMSDDEPDNLNVKVECDAEITGEPDDDGSPWSSTMYVDGDFVLSSGPTAEQLTVITTGDATLGGDLVGPSSQGGAATTTIIAGGNIQVTASPDIMSPTSGDFESLLFVAGKDLKINGNPTQYYEGIIAAHEHLGISGNPTLNGLIYAEDDGSTSTLVLKSFISGNLNITYNCGLGHLGFGKFVDMISWRQL